MSIIDPSSISIDENNSGPTGPASSLNNGRRIMSRKFKHSIGILKTLNPGQSIDGCLVCCAAPGCCPCCSVCPCCGDTEDIALIKKSSSYVYVRENSIEWNVPEVVMKPGPCIGMDPCAYAVQDNIKVIYFDDTMIESMTDKTRCCNELRTCLFGGKGEVVSIDYPICFGCCQKAAFPYFCMPVCCPKSISPCILSHEIYVDDAQQGLYDINNVVKECKKDELYYQGPVGHFKNTSD
jgi:hypothetical protein